MLKNIDYRKWASKYNFVSRSFQMHVKTKMTNGKMMDPEKVTEVIFSEPECSMSI